MTLREDFRFLDIGVECRWNMMLGVRAPAYFDRVGMPYAEPTIESANSRHVRAMHVGKRVPSMFDYHTLSRGAEDDPAYLRLLPFVSRSDLETHNILGLN